MNTTDIIMIAEKLGVSFMILLAVLYALAKSFYWFGDKVVLPITNKHLDFIERLEKGIDKVVETQGDIRDDLKTVLNNTKTNLVFENEKLKKQG